MREDNVMPEPSELLTLSQARKLLPRGRRGSRRSTSTLWRWSAKGVQGVRLRTLKIGRTAYTTRRWLFGFFEELARADEREAPQVLARPNAESDRRRLEQAERELDAMGM